MSDKTFKNFIKELDQGVNYSKYKNMLQLMTTYQKTFIDCYLNVKGL